MNKFYCETKRLVIRPVEQSDYEAFVTGYKNCGPAKNRFDEQFNADEMTREWFNALIERRKRENERDYSYKLNIFKDGASIGYCNIFPHYREDFQYGHIGYALHNNFWGMGYGTECVGALRDIGFRDVKLHRLEAHVNIDNPASKHVLLKAGFTFECVRKGFIFEDGAWTDNEIYYANNDDWRED